ncbi:hypothetical protein BBJ28_00001243 [Nothophytophthora sp. Chile5]|nr:hypothetical protein BBJ28_00001243 [Nothophytophthora sp. Chile5]
MTCSVSGVLAIVMLYVAFALNAVSTVLPLWSSTAFQSTNATEDFVEKAQFAAGIWGFCDDAKVQSNASSSDANSTLSFGRCYFFHTSTMYELPKLGTRDSFNYEDDISICSGYGAATNDSARLAYVETLVNLSGQPTDDFDSFLARSCGFIGYTTLIFGFAAPTCGLLACIALTLGITCLRRILWATGVGKWLSVAASGTTLVTFLVWIAQSHPIDEAHFNGSFVISVIATVFYINAFVLVARYSSILSGLEDSSQRTEASENAVPSQQNMNQGVETAHVTV